MRQDATPPPAGETSYVRVTQQIRQAIVTGEIPPGGWLRMVALAERFGVSVQPVREALQQLEGEGLLEILPNRGARVRGIDRTRLLHIYEIREAMESFFARRFALSHSRADLRELEAIQVEHDRALASGDLGQVGAVNEVFHRKINLHGGNSEAFDLVTRYYSLSKILRTRYGFSQDYATRVRREHYELLEAFSRHDACEAGRVGGLHVQGTRDDMLARLDEADRQAVA